MGYIGSDPKTKESVSTSQLINDSVTNEKIVDDILFTSVTSSIVSASHITASSYQGGFDTGTSTRISGSLGANATTIRNLTSAGITGSFSPSSASFSTRTTTLESASGSLSTRVTTNESDLTTLKGSGTVQGVSTGNTPTFAGVTVTGTLTAQEVHTEFESASIIFSSGSTIFGDTSDDIHRMTGSLNVSGAINLNDGNLNVTDTMTVSTRIGIGGSPSYRLDVQDTADPAQIRLKQSGNSSGLLIKNFNGNESQIVNVDNGPLVFKTNDNEVVRFKSGGNVGIGTNNPRYPLVVSGSGQNSYIHFPQDNNSTSDGLVVGFASEGNAYIWNYENSFLIFGANNSVRMKLNTESNISLSNNDSGTSNTVFGKNAGDNIDAGSNFNTFIGEGVSDASMTDATDNVGVGYQALSALTTGDDNVAVGMRALLDLESGTYNTAIGDSAGRGLVGGSSNTVIGGLAGDAMTDNTSNVVIGKSAFSAANGGENQNVVIGTDAGASIDNGDAVQNVIIGQDAGTGGTGIFRYNVAIGVNALNSTGNNQVQEVIAIGRDAATKINSNDASGTVAIGSFALGELTSGQANTAIGWAALYEGCDVGDFNTAVGYQCMYTFNPGSDGHGSNTAVGYKAGYSNSTSENNTFMGARAGEAVTGAGNVIIGREAGLAMTSGADCVIIGHAAAAANNTRDGLVIIGSGAGAALTSGDANTFVGGGAGRLVSSGDHNTLLGYQAGYDLHSAGSHNTLIGKAAGENMNASGDGNNVALGSETADTITSGTNNTILGTASDAAAGAVNQIVIGYGVSGQGDNYAVIGNGSQTRLYIGDDQGGQLFAGTSTINTSDRRIKKDIEDSDLGLNFINKLRPITYRKKEVIDYDDSLKTKMSWYKNDTPPRVLDEEQKEKIRLGFIAQEVGEVLQDLGFSENNEIVQIDENTTQQGLAYERFVPTLVKAVQELSSEIENIKKTCKCMNE